MNCSESVLPFEHSAGDFVQWNVVGHQRWFSNHDVTPVDKFSVSAAVKLICDTKTFEFLFSSDCELSEHDADPAAWCEAVCPQSLPTTDFLDVQSMYFYVLQDLSHVLPDLKSFLTAVLSTSSALGRLYNSVWSLPHIILERTLTTKVASSFNSGDKLTVEAYRRRIWFAVVSQRECAILPGFCLLSSSEQTPRITLSQIVQVPLVCSKIRAGCFTCNRFKFADGSMVTISLYCSL